MNRAMPPGADLGVQHGFEKRLLGDGLEIPENGRGAESTVRILSLAATPQQGYKLLRELRSDPQTKNIPVIILTH